MMEPRNGSGHTRARWTCPRCGLLVHLRLPALVPMPSGLLGIPEDTPRSPRTAIGLHLAVGCANR